MYILNSFAFSRFAALPFRVSVKKNYLRPTSTIVKSALPNISPHHNHLIKYKTFRPKTLPTLMEKIQSRVNDNIFKSCKNNKINPSHQLSEPLLSSTNEESLISQIKKRLLQQEDISTILRSIPSVFFEHKSQERAEFIFTNAMKELQSSSVEFPTSGSIKDIEAISGTLDSTIFQLSHSYGIETDIPLSSKDKNAIHVYQVASQYNATEAPTILTPKVGEAMQQTHFDFTQGPLAQRTNPIAFELVNAFLANLGFNMLSEVLPTAGLTYSFGAAIEHGYLRPNEANISTLTQEFKSNFAKAKYVCYSSLSKSWPGQMPVYIFLQSAPAIGYVNLKSASDELEKYAALSNYLAFFRYGIALSEKYQKPIILHATAVGGGVFGNHVNNIKWGFQKAGLYLQSQMKQARLTVQLEAFFGKGAMEIIANDLNLTCPPTSRLNIAELDKL